MVARLATEFNLSETCYLTRIADSPNGTTIPRFRLRWFTPVAEVKWLLQNEKKNISVVHSILYDRVVYKWRTIVITLDPKLNIIAYVRPVWSLVLRLLSEYLQILCLVL